MEDFLRRGERPNTLAGRLQTFFEVPDNVLGIAQTHELLHNLDAAFFQVGEARGGLLAKFYSTEETSEDRLRAGLEHHGLEASRLEDEGRLRLIFERRPVMEEEREDCLRTFSKKPAAAKRSGPASTGGSKLTWKRRYGSRRR